MPAVSHSHSLCGLSSISVQYVTAGEERGVERKVGPVTGPPPLLALRLTCVGRLQLPTYAYRISK